jgi:uncharacterized membrane protein YbhN (UPF0104 family)
MILSIALGYKINPIEMFLIVPLIFIVALVPFSLAGWGVRELGAIWLFNFIGVTNSTAFTISISYGLMLLIASLPGLLYFLFFT